MNPHAFEIPSLLMATATLTVSAIVALIILRWLRPNSHRIHRVVWLADDSIPTLYNIIGINKWIVIVIIAITQSLTCVYYLSRRRPLAELLEQTPRWALDAVRAR